MPTTIRSARSKQRQIDNHSAIGSIRRRTRSIAIAPDGYGNLLAINNFDIDRDTINTFNQQAVDGEFHTAAKDAEQINPDGYRGVLHIETARGFLPTGGRPGSDCCPADLRY